MQYIWPLAIIVFFNIMYQVCAKGVPSQMNTYASMSVTYGVATLVSIVAYFITSKGQNIFKALAPTNWATVVLGIVITGLEVGFIQAYKAGWKVSTLATVTNGILAIALIFVGMLLYKEHISWTQILGVFICLIGLILINR